MTTLYKNIKEFIKELIEDNPDTRYIISIRKEFSDKDTLGELYIHDDLVNNIGYTLEDEVRPFGEKVHGETAIPQHLLGYNVSVRKSPKFGETVVLWTKKERDVYIIERDGIRFEYVLAHGGNTEKDTDACILVAKNRINAHTIQGSLKEEVKNIAKAWIKEGYNVKWIVVGNYNDRIGYINKEKVSQ